MGPPGIHGGSSPISRRPRMVRFVTPAENAELVIELEQRLRLWPRVAAVRELDDRVRNVSHTLRRATTYERERAFRSLDGLRFTSEPTISELVRVGVSLEDAERRMTDRLRTFELAFRE